MYLLVFVCVLDRATHCIIVQVIILSVTVSSLPSLQNLLLVFSIDTVGANGCVCEGVWNQKQGNESLIFLLETFVCSLRLGLIQMIKLQNNIL